MGGEVVATGAEVRDFAQLVDGTVPVVSGRDKGFQVDELVGSAAFAVRAADVLGLHQGRRVRVQTSAAGVVRGGAAVHHLGKRAHTLEAAH